MTNSTFTITKCSNSKAALTEGGEGIEFETAAVLASAGPLGIAAMGAFPLSLIASGRRHFDSTLTRRPERTTEELESPQPTEKTALTQRIETTKPGARRYPQPAIRQGDGWLAALVILIALAALFVLGLPVS